MKHLLLFLLCQGSLDSFCQDTLLGQPHGQTIIQSISSVWRLSMPANADTVTVTEWMHISLKTPGVVVVRKAKAIRVNGLCIQHLDCSGKPLPIHYHVGWCEGKEELFYQLVNGRRGR